MIRLDELKIVSAVTAILLILLMLFFSGCGGGSGGGSSSGGNRISSPPGEPADASSDIVKSRATIILTAGSESVLMRRLNNLFSAYAAAQTASITITNTPNTTMTINTAGLIAPPISDVNLSFGNIVLSSLQDNNLKLCGAGGTTKCTHAAIRIYTTGTTAGFFNAVDNYAQPVSVTYNASTSVLGLIGSPIYLQTITIPNNRNTVKLTDFTAIRPQVYDISSDFSDAGVGNFSVSIVVEFVLQT
jgi:hypothetical protein